MQEDASHEGDDVGDGIGDSVEGGFGGGIVILVEVVALENALALVVLALAHFDPQLAVGA